LLHGASLPHVLWNLSFGLKDVVVAMATGWVGDRMRRRTRWRRDKIDMEMEDIPPSPEEESSFLICIST